MAVYRQIYTTFWQDDFILSLPYTERYFYIYLMTNSKTTICGIYELPRAVAVMETGLTLSKIEELLSRFQNQYHRVVCSSKTNEIVITNWLKYNNNPSPKVQTAIKTSFELVKDKSLISFIYGNNAKRSENNGSDTVSPKKDTVSKDGDTISTSDDNDTVNDTVPVSDEKEKETKRKPRTQKAFIPPTVDEIRAYAEERQSKVDPQGFWDYFDVAKWIDSEGKPVLNWKQKFITWDKKEKEKEAKRNGKSEIPLGSTRSYGEYF